MELKIPNTATGIEPALLSYGEVCRLLGCRMTKLRELLPRLSVKMLGRRPMVTTDSVRAFLAALPDAGPAAGAANPPAPGPEAAR
jgi:hypothetical protein